MSRRRAVITGLGPVTAVGTGKEALWEALRAGRSGIGRLTAFDPSGFSAQCAAEVRGFDASAILPGANLKRLDRYAQFAVSSAALAIADSGLPLAPGDEHPRIGVSFGTALGGIAGAEAEHVAFLRSGPRAVAPSLALQVFGGAAHSNIAIHWGLQGPGTTNSNSCASGTVAVGEALRFIRDGMADVVIAGGAEAPLSPLTFGAFAIIRSMSRRDPPEACCPFDARRDGFVMGEGAAALVIEELGHARRRGARIYAEVLGFAMSNDAHHMTAPRPGGAVVRRTMQAALDDAGARPEDIDYINAHGSSTRLNDAEEAAAIKAVFGPHAPHLAVSGTKPFTGHPLGASGAIEAAICALAVDRGFIPPTLHLEQPDTDLDLVPHTGREQPVRRALSNSFGFGGINACLVLGGWA
jgi:3-oxoacyl-[acyl-carrier-protein] synthase II